MCYIILSQDGAFRQLSGPDIIQSARSACSGIFPVFIRPLSVSLPMCENHGGGQDVTGRTFSILTRIIVPMTRPSHDLHPFYHSSTPIIRPYVAVPYQWIRPLKPDIPGPKEVSMREARLKFSGPGRQAAGDHVVLPLLGVVLSLPGAGLSWNHTQGVGRNRAKLCTKGCLRWIP